MRISYILTYSNDFCFTNVETVFYYSLLYYSKLLVIHLFIFLYFLAPRIKSDFAHVQWNEMNSVRVYNLARALKGLYPLQTSWNGITVKLLDVVRPTESDIDRNYKPGFVKYDKIEKLLKVLCADSKWICVKSVRVAGKSIMSAMDFNNGYINKEDIHRRYFT